MNNFYPRLALPIFLLLKSGLLFAQSSVDADTPAVETSMDLAEQRERYEQQIAELESEFGPLDFRLLEPVAALTDLLRQEGDTEGVERLLARSQLLLRVEKGLNNQEQIPIIVEQMRADFRSGAYNSWEAVRDHLESIFYIRAQAENPDPELLLTSLNDIRAWHLLAMYLDVPEERIRHIAESRQVQEVLFQLAGDLYGPNNPKQIPWLYSIAAESYRTTDYLEATGFLSVGASNYLYREASINLIYRIRDIAESSADLETRAMAMVYLGDFQLLRREERGSIIGGRLPITRRGPAGPTYRRAMEMFQEAGVDQAKIDEYFSKPQTLPVIEFYSTLDEALAVRRAAEQESIASDPVDTTAENAVRLEDFYAWTSSLPKAEISVAPNLVDSINTEQNTALVSFRVDSIGRPKFPRIVYSDPDENLVQSAARKAIEVSHFRPAYLDGRWRQVRDVRMKVILPPQLAD